MATVRVEHTDTTVTCTGARHQLRVSRHPGGGLRVEAATKLEGRWRRVDEDLVRLVRAVVHLRLAAPSAMPEVVAGACHLAGVAAPARVPVPPDPVRAIVRATRTLPATCWPSRSAGGCRPCPRTCRRTCCRRSGRRPQGRRRARLRRPGHPPPGPSVRHVFHGTREPDLFTLTVAAAASRHLEPDHVVALLDRGPRRAGRGHAPAAHGGAAGRRRGARGAAAGAPGGAAAHRGARRRGRARAAAFVATEAPPADLAAVVAGGAGIGAAAVAVAVVSASAGPGGSRRSRSVSPCGWSRELGGRPRDAAPGPFTLHQVTDKHRLTTLGRHMSNCLATYDRKLRGRHRIVEVRQDDRTRYAVYIKDGRIEMFEAAHNRGPDPADVPVVRALLEQEGHLAATLEPPRSGRGTRAPRRRATGRILPVPVGGRRADEPARADQGCEDRGSTARRTASAPATATHPGAAEPPGISVQGLATALLDPAASDPPSWQELAAALWATGVLPQLPDPAASTYACVVRDLARRIAVGEVAGLPRREPPSAAARQAARRELLAAPRPRHRGQLAAAADGERAGRRAAPLTGGGRDDAAGGPAACARCWVAVGGYLLPPAFSRRRLKRSTRPPVSTSFCLPV
jgi:hypothetical protein